MSEQKLEIPATLAWSAACAAYRINGNEYVKFAENSRQANNQLLLELTKDQTQITDEDRETGARARHYIQQAMTVAALKGKIDSWGKVMAQVSSLDNILDSFQLSVLASLPTTYFRYLERERVHERLSNTDRVYQPKIGDKLEIDVEVLENRYSKNWATFYVTAVDTENRAWMFSYPKGMKRGSRARIKGTVKRLLDGMVQLNRVKLVSEEVK